MTDKGVGRRDFLKSAVVGGAAAATTGTAVVSEAAQAQPAPAPPPSYTFLNTEEAAFVAVMADHMIPADELSPKGTDMGLAVYIDRALASAWGKGDRLYMSGPWKLGVPSQGYQLPLTPAQLYRAGIEATNLYCTKTYGKTFDKITEAQREEVLQGLSRGTITFASGLPVRDFWNAAYQTVIEGLFSDPIYGGNRNKASWRMLGFPGLPATYADKIDQYRNKRYLTEPQSIADFS